MTEQIKQLIEKAGEELEAEYGDNFPPDDMYEYDDKFHLVLAKLIVQECADFVVDQARYAAFNGDVHAEAKHALLGTLIKKHFGV